jgi:hypothetical protein
MSAIEGYVSSSAVAAITASASSVGNGGGSRDYDLFCPTAVRDTPIYFQEGSSFHDLVRRVALWIDLKSGSQVDLDLGGFLDHSAPTASAPGFPAVCLDIPA